MKRMMYSALVTAFVLIQVQCSVNDPKLKVIVDSDMIEGFDDGVALTMLLASDDVSVLGLTTVTGNCWAAEGLAYGIRQAEPFGNSGIRFVQGSQHPLRQDRLATLQAEIERNPGAESCWTGAVSSPEVTDWKEFYRTVYSEEPSFSASDEDASEFIARQIKAYPGEVTILAIGPCTNIARAIERHPEIVARTKEIIYMGGAVFCDGNTTPYAELNFLYDPEAAAICLRAPFPRQTLVSLDVCNTTVMDKALFDGVDSVITNARLKETYRHQHLYPVFSSDPEAKSLVWDVISAAILLCPDVVTQYSNVRLDVDDNPSSPTYGQSYITASENRQIIRVPVKVDSSRIFGMIREAYSSLR